MKKGEIVLIFLFVLLFSAAHASASLGISPAVARFNFAGEEKITIDYSVRTDQPLMNIEMYAEGDLAQYVSFDKKSSIGPGAFTATISLPQKIDVPGKHIIYIAARQEPDVNSGFIGTAITIKAAVVVYVPYPGKYIDSEFSVPDANVDEQVPVEIKVTSRGTEEVLVSPTVDFYDGSGKKVETLSFTPRAIKTNDVANFLKYLDSSKLKPDNYLAIANIDYGAGENAVLNDTFKIGNLNVGVTNFSQNATAGEINKFLIKIKSNWNGKIDGVFANINISNADSSYTFGTSPENLVPWEEKEIFGYFDAQDAKPGEYNAEIRLNYMGQTTYASGNITLLKKKISKIWLMSGALLLILLLIIIAYFVIKKLKNSNKKRTR